MGRSTRQPSCATPPVPYVNPPTLAGHIADIQTGLGKGVETTHFNMTSQLQAINTVYEPNDINKDVHLTFLPFSHMYALTLDVVHCLTTGTTMVILPRFEEKNVLEAIQKYKVTWSLVVPPILIILRESKLLDKYDLTTWKGMMSAAAPLGDDLAKSVEKRLPNCRIVQAYGELTEKRG
jgi:acyl-CoA synthetase (AMP-forming)/AMP-acid ligase II